MSLWNEITSALGGGNGGLQLKPEAQQRWDEYSSGKVKGGSSDLWSVGGTKPAPTPAPNPTNYPTTQAPSPGITGGYDTASLEGVLQDIQDKQNKADEDARRAEEQRIQNEYENQVAQLDIAEGGLRSELGLTEEGIRAGYQEALPGLQRARGEAVSGLEAQRAEAGRQESQGMRQARQLFNELMTGGQQFAGTSVGEAYGELLGRDTANIMGNIRAKAAETINGINSEVVRVNEFYDSTINNLQKEMQRSLRGARESFNNELAKIREARNVAERDKAYQRQDALARFQQRASEVREAIGMKQYELEQWRQEKANALSQASNFAAKSFQDSVGRIAEFNAFARSIGYTPTQQDYQKVVSGEIGPYMEAQQWAAENPQPGTSAPQDSMLGGLGGILSSPLGTILSGGAGPIVSNYMDGNNQ